jgi:hypothetical protein
MKNCPICWKILDENKIYLDEIDRYLCSEKCYFIALENYENYVNSL